MYIITQGCQFLYDRFKTYILPISTFFTGKMRKVLFETFKNNCIFILNDEIIFYGDENIL